VRCDFLQHGFRDVGCYHAGDDPMRDIIGPMIAFAFAIAVCVAALAVENQCEPVFATMVGGCQ
jgi:hypothetical protein